MTIKGVLVDGVDAKSVVITWSAMADTDVGDGFAVGGYGELTLQAVGDGTSVELQGSNDGGTTWGSMSTTVTVNVSGNKILRVLEHPALVRPKMTGGTSTKALLSAAKQYY